MAQKRGPIKTLPGKFEAVIQLFTGDARKRRDADNRIKAVFDFATRVGLIKDDSYCERVTAEWVDKDAAPLSGCRLILTGIE
jgi:Holliday junction resolvase RusA-like endonuclease